MKCTLRISWRDATKTALDVARIMKDLDVSASISEGWSVCPDEHDETQRHIERSVVIDMFNVDKRKIIDSIWPAVRDFFDLTCAHVHEDGTGFNGCILDYDIPSNCPGKKRS